MLAGRFVPMLLALAIAGSLAGARVQRAAWVLLGTVAAVHGWRMEGSLRPICAGKTARSRPSGARVCRDSTGLGGTVQDLLYIGLTIVVFAALWLLVKGVERFER
jgi:hypothetical protein